VVRDVTRRRLRGQRLTVLNRVLRHNLRNRMTSIIGRAELLTDADRDEDELAEGILTTADDLVTLGERAREVEQIMSVTPRAGEATRLATVVESVIETVGAAFPAVAIRTDVDPNLSVPVDERILEPVLRNLVENAAEHNDAETPTVDVTADVDPDRPDAVAVTVADNGPGIPERERAVIRDGEESPLEHGSGLGLWAVYWGVTRTGGDLSFVAEEPGGARVVVRLPRGASEVATADPSAVAEAD
jgi:signal transduction histidine kinase